MKNKRNELHTKRKLRVRKKISGTASRPRLSVFRSAKHIYVQAIDDAAGCTVMSASTVDKEIAPKISDCKKAESAKMVGTLIGKRLKEKGVASAVFDRNGFSYKGRVASIADGARESGLSL